MKKVWVLEDDPGIGEVLTMLLEGEGYKVAVFESATQFNTALRAGAEDVDAMVMDVFLPDGNGIYLCDKVKTNAKLSNIPVIVMSANTTFADVERFCRADDFIPKPFDIDEMLRKVGRLVN